MEKWQRSLRIQMECMRNGGPDWCRVRREGERMWWGTWWWGTIQNLWIYECLARVQEEPHKLHRSVTAWQQCARPSAQNDRLWVFRRMTWCLYTPLSLTTPPPPPTTCHSVHLCYLYISIRPPLSSACLIQSYWAWQPDVLATMACKCISKFIQSASPCASPSTLSCLLQTDWLYVCL